LLVNITLGVKEKEGVSLIKKGEGVSTLPREEGRKKSDTRIREREEGRHNFACLESQRENRLLGAGAASDSRKGKNRPFCRGKKKGGKKTGIRLSSYASIIRYRGGSTPTVGEKAVHR